MFCDTGPFYFPGNYILLGAGHYLFADDGPVGQINLDQYILSVALAAAINGKDMAVYGGLDWGVLAARQANDRILGIEIVKVFGGQLAL